MKIGIIGSGLMGGSIYKGLQRASLLGDGWMDRIGEFDLLILAVPIPTIFEIADIISEHRPQKPLLVLDIGSVKEQIAAKFEHLTDGNLEFLGTHPMAGKEKSGYEHSDPAIFKDAVWVITPHAKNSERSLQRAEELIRSLGAKPMRVDAAEHDRRAALVSQLPYLIGKTLLDLVDPESLAMAGPGFKSMVRIAYDNEEMRREIGRYNKVNIEFFLGKYIDALKKLVSST